MNLIRIGADIINLDNVAHVKKLDGFVIVRLVGAISIQFAPDTPHHPDALRFYDWYKKQARCFWEPADESEAE